MFDHISIDIETLGVYAPELPIISIGAVRFDPRTGTTADVFHQKIDIKTIPAKAFPADMSTVLWWMGQSQEALSKITNGVVMDYETCLYAFHEFCKAVPRSKPWGNGATFDIVALEAHFRHLDIPPPWKYYDVRDMRTIMDLAKQIVGMDKKAFAFTGTKHDALADAKHQAHLISTAWQKLGGCANV